MTATTHGDEISLADVDWIAELPRLGLDSLYLERPGKSRPCPLHPVAGSTKFRFLKPYERGIAVCNDCGILTPGSLAMQLNGWNWANLFQALRGNGVASRRRVHRVETPDDAAAQAEKAKRNFQKMRKWWRSSKAIALDRSSARAYLEARIPRLALQQLGTDLRSHPGMAYFEEDESGKTRRTQWPALLALFRDGEGQVQYMHRIYVRPDGQGKAPVPDPRKMFVPGKWVPGCAVRVGFSENDQPRVIGVAEGVEKACAIFTACSARFPVWASGSADNMAALQVPSSVEVVHIFADNNLPTKGHPKGHGQECAAQLREKLAARGIKVTLHVAKTAGGDHEDDWLAMCSQEHVS